MNIIDEIAEARHYFLYENIECNTVVIPENRKVEMHYALQHGLLSYSPLDKQSIFECDIIYSADVDKIKVGYLK